MTAPEPVLHVLATLARDIVDVLRARSVADAGRSPPEIEVETVTDLEELEDHAAEWNALVFQAARYRPQASHAFVASYLEYLRAPHVQWACVVARRGSELVGVLPFLIARGRGGVYLDAATLEADLVVAPGEEAHVIPALLGGVARVVPGWVALRFDELQAGSPTIAYLQRDRGAAVLVESGRSSYLPLPARYDDYLAAVGSHFRQNLRRQTRKLFGLADVAVEFVSARDATDAHLDAFVAVEGTGWKARRGNALVRREELVEYYRSASRALAAAGSLEWAFLRAEGRVVAAFLMEHVGRRLALDKIAYDEGFAQLAPGNVLMGRVIEHAIASGDFDEIDFLTDHEWNRRWHAEVRATYAVTIYHHAAPWYVADVARRTWRGARP